MKKQKKSEKEKEFERCVICGKQTEYLFDTYISERECYIDGVGQLCEKCYCNFFIKKKKNGI